MIELFAPVVVNFVTPEPAPKSVVEPAPAFTVSFGAAKIAVVVVVVMVLPPAVVSTTAEAAPTVTEEFGLAITSGPLVVDKPLPLKTVNVVPELKKELKADVAPLAPVNCAGSEPPPIVVVPLIILNSLGLRGDWGVANAA